MAEYTFKVANEPWEIEQIHRLNYETFAEEIPQHQRNPERILIDKFHNENSYIICRNGTQVVAMLAVRGKRPFSLDNKLPDLDRYLPPHKGLCEIRLLSVRKDCRRSRIVHGLLESTARFCIEHGFDLAVISGILQQQKLYEHMGFVPFGPVVGADGAKFQPMYLTTQAHAETSISGYDSEEQIPSVLANIVNLLPGPVEVTPRVKKALAECTISHRSDDFLRVHRQTRKRLCHLANAKHCEFFMGSGTLANDVIAGQLRREPGTGLILSNGEFGERLIRQARRAGAKYETLSLEWGKPFQPEAIEAKLANPDISWIWTVHCETSTGMLNDLAMLKSIARPRNLKLCLDCISSIGTVPVDLDGVYLASAVSGKCLRSYAGVSMVFYDHDLQPGDDCLPAYLDLYAYASNDGVPYTLCSNLVYALHASLEETDQPQRLAQTQKVTGWLRREFRAMGLDLLIDDIDASPHVITICLDRRYKTVPLCDALKIRGFMLSYKSEYLVSRNWMQICLMSNPTLDRVESLPALLKQELARQAASAT
ncbi:MAG: aminotransferase class V-fold PLP-dependent enzyme [Phycisphaerae bacterium]|nr:aminotransferase class V-fold PLP-dependent enzyme [Phycisphaerae bacterium]